MTAKRLHIQMLGAFTIRSEAMTEPVELSLTGRSRRLWTLVAYLVANKDRGISAQELIDILWPRSAGNNPLARLQNNVSRARAALRASGFDDAQDLIAFKNGLYCWAPEYETVLDLDTLASVAMELAANAVDEENVLLAYDAIRLYKGDFLGNALSEPWAVNTAAYYHSLALELCLNILDELVELELYEEIERLCLRALSLAPDVEEFSIQLMRAYVIQNTPQRALDHYAHLKKLMRELYGVAPSPAIEAEREEAIQAIHGTAITEQTVRDFLSSSRGHARAFFCSNATFREIAQLNLRAAKRHGAKAQLALVGIRDTNEWLNDAPKRQALHLNNLRETISEVLRASDPFTKISSSQLLILLPEASRESATRVLERVLKTFRTNYPFARVELTYSLIDITELM